MSALRPYKVLELAESVSGEYCGKLLADFGAELIKIEAPGCGSPTRQLGPLLHKDGVPALECSSVFAYLNTNKYSVVLDLHSAQGQQQLVSLLSRVDVLIDDHAPGYLASLGLDPEQLAERYPQLVPCSITAYGQTPPPERRHAEDLTVFHSSGWGFHTPSGVSAERRPLKAAGRFLPSYEAGMEAALCIAAALYARESSGLGRFIDIAKQEVMASRADYVLAQMLAGDMEVGTSRQAFDLFGPAGIFACRDGYAYIWMSAPAHWDALRKLLGNPEWMNAFPERWLERECTPARVAQCRAQLAAWLREQDKDTVAAQAQALGLTLVPVNDARDLLRSPQYQFRGFFQELEHPVLGKALYPTVPYRLSQTPAVIERPAPLLGQHSQAQLRHPESTPHV